MGRKMKTHRHVLPLCSEPKPVKTPVSLKPQKPGLRRIMIATMLGILGAFLLLGSFGRTPEHASFAVPSTADAGHKYVAQQIQEFSGFEWVLAENPEVSDDERSQFDEIDYRQWRWMRLRMPEGDGWLEVGLGRPLEWLEANHVTSGATIHLDLPELGARGEAEVLSVKPCHNPGPKPSPDHRLVTGTYKHASTKILDLQIAGLSEPVGCTSNHPFWSEDRQAFVEAGDLTVFQNISPEYYKLLKG